MDELTPEEVAFVVDEINAWNVHYPQMEQASWYVHAIEQLDLVTEVYEVSYENGYSEIWARTGTGKLEPVQKITYIAPDYYAMKGKRNVE